MDWKHGIWIIKNLKRNVNVWRSNKKDSEVCILVVVEVPCDFRIWIRSNTERNFRRSPFNSVLRVVGLAQEFRNNSCHENSIRRICRSMIFNFFSIYKKLRSPAKKKWRGLKNFICWKAIWKNMFHTCIVPPPIYKKCLCLNHSGRRFRTHLFPPVVTSWTDDLTLTDSPDKGFESFDVPKKSISSFWSAELHYYFNDWTIYSCEYKKKCLYSYDLEPCA